MNTPRLKEGGRERRGEGDRRMVRGEEGRYSEIGVWPGRLMEKIKRVGRVVDKEKSREEE